MNSWSSSSSVGNVNQYSYRRVLPVRPAANPARVIDVSINPAAPAKGGGRGRWLDNNVNWSSPPANSTVGWLVSAYHRVLVKSYFSHGKITQHLPMN